MLTACYVEYRKLIPLICIIFDIQPHKRNIVFEASGILVDMVVIWHNMSIIPHVL